MTDAATVSLQLVPAVISESRRADSAGCRRVTIAGVRATLCVAASLVLIGCSGVGTLTISEPRGGAVINAETTTVRGTAPPNTEVIHDKPSAADSRTLSDAQGAWRIEVDLAVGDNVLTFRLGNDEMRDSQKQVLVVRER